MNATALVSEALTFHAGIDTEASHQLFDHPIAFEVDQVDEFLQAGWSVLVVGNARPLDESLLLLDVAQSPQPWPEGRRALVVQLPLTMMTGRRSPPVVAPWEVCSHDQPVYSGKADSDHTSGATSKRSAASNALSSSVNHLGRIAWQAADLPQICRSRTPCTLGLSTSALCPTASWQNFNPADQRRP